MGPRVALNFVEATAATNIFEFLGTELIPFPLCRGGLDARLPNTVQRSIREFATQPEVPQWIYNPPIDLESLREFGEWCRDGCPVTVGSETYRYRYGDLTRTTPSSSSWERVVYHI